MSTLLPSDVQARIRRLTALNLSLSSLEGQAKTLNAQRTELVHSIGILKARQDILGPQMQSVLQSVQDSAHRKSVGVFEDLLSTFVSEVIPDAGDIQLKLSISSSVPALDIVINNGGDEESILRGNGGGLTNVVVAALSFAALNRTQNRQFMLLDEPDCWLRATNVPAFSKVVADVANPRIADDGSKIYGCQTVMISHNDLSLMTDEARLVRLRVEKDLETFAKRHHLPIKYVGDVKDSAYVTYVDAKKPYIEVTYRDDGDQDKNALAKGFPFVQDVAKHVSWEPSEPGIRWIEVCNLQHHVITRVDLDPGLNILTGDVNTGKSTIAQMAIRAMAYGDLDDLAIRHGASHARIRMGLEDNYEVELVRARKGSPKMLYRLYKDGVMLREGRGDKNSAPVFISDVLKINKVDGLDFQLRSQKEPIFLLNESAPMRAKLLSIGSESGILTEMMTLLRSQMKKDSEKLLDEESRLAVINRQLLALEPVIPLKGIATIVDSILVDLDASVQRASRLDKAIANLAPVVDTLKLAPFVTAVKAPPRVPKLHRTETFHRAITLMEENRVGSQPIVLPKTPELPKLLSTTGLSKAITAIAELQSIVKLPMPSAPPKAPKLAATAALSRAVTLMAQHQPMLQLTMHVPVAPKVPAIRSTDGLRKAGVALATAEKAITTHTNSVDVAKSDETRAKLALDQFKAELGVCPSCHRAFDHTH